MTLKDIGNGVWKVVLSVFSIIAILLALFLLIGTLEVGGNFLNEENAFLDLTKWIFFMVLVVSAFLWAGNYLFIRGGRFGMKLSKDRVTSPLSTREVPIVKVFFLIGVGCALATFLISIHFKLTDSIVIVREEMYQEAQEPLMTYYFDANVADRFSAYKLGHDIDKRGYYDTNFLIDSINISFNKQMMKATRIEVVGYADESGSRTKNLSLSEERAQTLLELLVAAGIPENIITVRNGGIILHACSQTDTRERKSCLSENRRVDVFFYPYEPKVRRIKSYSAFDSILL